MVLITYCIISLFTVNIYLFSYRNISVLDYTVFLGTHRCYIINLYAPFIFPGTPHC